MISSWPLSMKLGRVHVLRIGMFIPVSSKYSAMASMVVVVVYYSCGAYAPWLESVFRNNICSHMNHSSFLFNRIQLSPLSQKWIISISYRKG